METICFGEAVGKMSFFFFLQVSFFVNKTNILTVPRQQAVCGEAELQGHRQTWAVPGGGVGGACESPIRNHASLLAGNIKNSPEHRGRCDGLEAWVTTT